MHPGAQDPEATALVMAQSGETRTYGELAAAAHQGAHLLRELGLEPGDHVALCVENRPEFLELLWGAHVAGTYYTAISTRLTADEIAYIARDCGARVLVLSARYADRGPAVAAALDGAVEHRLSLGGEVEGFEPIEPRLAAHPDTPPPGELVAGADMLYSSGTTGKPKGIKPKGVGRPLDEQPVIITPVLKGMLGFQPGDVYLSPAPLYHAAPLRWVMGAQQLGGKVVMLERFDAQDALDLIAEHRVTHTQLVPTMFVRLLRLDDAAKQAADVSSLRVVIHAGAPCARETKQQMIDWWGPIVHEYYASTEGCGLTWVTSEQWLEKPGTVGKSLIGVAHVVGDDGQEAAPGETGAIAFSDGPQFEYHNAPEKTAEAYDDRGWASFGDIGHLDEDGFLFLTDRASYMIITGGVNVYPQEAEDALIAHDAVLDAAVFGIPHEEWGEEVKAVVQPVEEPADDAARDALEAELLAHCRSRLADVKCPRSVDFRAELPRHETGKLYKRLLKDEYAAQAAAPA